MADVQALKRIYRRLAEAETNSGTLAEQKAWLLQTFVARAKEVDGGGFKATTANFEGGTFSGLYEGASAEDRALALDAAIREIEAEIAGVTDLNKPAVLIPRFCNVPR